MCLFIDVVQNNYQVLLEVSPDFDWRNVYDFLVVFFRSKKEPKYYMEDDEDYDDTIHSEQGKMFFKRLKGLG